MCSLIKTKEWIIILNSKVWNKVIYNYQKKKKKSNCSSVNILCFSSPQGKATANLSLMNELQQINQ